MGLGIIFGTFIAKFIFHSVKKNKEQQNIQKIMKDAKEESEFIKLILQLHPEVERELIAIYQEESPHKIQRIINKYLTEHILKASNELVYERMYEEMQIMKLLQEKNSTLCVAFAVGKFNEQIKNINIKKMNEINIKILQNSKINSNIFQPDESFGEKLINQLKKQKYNLNHLQDLSLQNIDDDKKCRYMIEFSNAILSLKIEDAVYVYKNMLYITYTKGE